MTSGLTTTKAVFIDEATREGRLFISQPYELYTEANHDVWRRLFARMLPRWETHANDAFLRGLDALCLDPTRVPRLNEVNRFLAARTGFRTTAVSGYVPAADFFACLGRREFPTTVTIRDGAQLDYLPEPDIFHDIAGHVPMHADPAFAEVLTRIGACRDRAVRRAASIESETERERRLKSVERALARFFWFTVEFGLMRGAGGDSVRAYGSGLLSSFGEIEHAVMSPDVRRVPMDLAWVVNQAFQIDSYQRLLFVVEDFGHLSESVATIERWLDDGRLDNVAPDAGVRD